MPRCARLTQPLPGCVLLLQILSKKVSPRAFAVAEGTKKGENTGEIGIEGTAIEEPEEVRLQCPPSKALGSGWAATP